MAFPFALRMTLPVGLVLTLTACEEPARLSGPDDGETAQVAAGSDTIVRDVERPDIFSVTENGLWDGRPSLGGVWVAHPDVAEPERVVITNVSNGQSVDGALFRRERENPGPRIQVSSDAAAALDILAGQPTELRVLAVRQEEVEIEVERPISDEAPLIDPETGMEIQMAPDESAPIEAASLAVVEPTAEVAVAPEDDSGALPEVPGVIETVSEEEAAPRRGFWGRFRDSLRNDRGRGAAAAGVGVEAAGNVAASVEVAPAELPPAVETAPLDPVASAAAAAIDAAEAAPPAPAEPLDNAYVQIGLFSQENNAEAAAERLRQKGIVPTITETDRGGTTFWRVVVGPVPTVEDRDALIETARDLGYRDAFITDS